MNIIAIFFLFNQNIMTPAELYNQGNKYYEEGNYQGAIEVYEQSATQISNTKLLYNLGNSYFKSGKIGKAILNYQRATFFTPRDKDIKHNLAFARNYRIDKVKRSVSPIAEIFSDLFHFFSLYEVQILTTLLFLIASVFAALYIIYRKNIYGYMLISGIFLCILFSINWFIWAQDLNGRGGVITVPETDALSGPGADYKEILVLHDGTEVKIREFRNDYALVQLPGGMGGWVPKNAFEEIFR
jgi:tetratricopeptide (TPR) repeat protein